MSDLTPYLTRPEREEAFGLSFGAGWITANDRRLAELVSIAEGRLADQLGVPNTADLRVVSDAG